MANLKYLRNRIKSVWSTQKITKAMQMVAASRLRRIKNQIVDSMHYVQVLNDVLASVSYNLDSQDVSTNIGKFFSRDTNHKHVLLVIFTSERGLCGSFNHSIIKAAKEDILSFEKEGKIVKLIIIGHKGFEDFNHSAYSKYIDSYFNIVNDIQGLAICIRQQIMKMFEEGRIETCYLYFNEFKSAIKQTTKRMQILPLQIPKAEVHNSHNELEGEGLILNMINLYLLGQIHLAFIQNKASEEGARMVAMDNSTKNAEELINKLNLTFNRTRQAIITGELIEIISGAEAV